MLCHCCRQRWEPSMGRRKMRTALSFPSNSGRKRPEISQKTHCQGELCSYRALQKAAQGKVMLSGVLLTCTYKPPCPEPCGRHGNLNQSWDLTEAAVPQALVYSCHSLSDKRKKKKNHIKFYHWINFELGFPLCDLHPLFCSIPGWEK